MIIQYLEKDMRLRDVHDIFIKEKTWPSLDAYIMVIT